MSTRTLFLAIFGETAAVIVIYLATGYDPLWFKATPTVLAIGLAAYAAFVPPPLPSDDRARGYDRPLEELAEAREAASGVPTIVWPPRDES